MSRKKSRRKKTTKWEAPSLTSPFPSDLGGEPGAPERPKPISRMDMERFNRAVGKILAKQNFKDIDEANAFLSELIKDRTIYEIIAEVEESPEERAQELAGRAMESDSLAEIVSLCREALQLDPHCIDALFVEAELKARSPEEYAMRLRGIVRDAEQRFGAQYMEENRGHFWGMVETRPYMRARQSLVMALEETSQIPEAIAECEGMLELNPSDNQGIRDLLRGYYLQTGNIEGVRRLNKDYPEEIFAAYVWSAVLERWLSGDMKQAEKIARDGHKRNPHVAAYLTGKKKPPKSAPEYYSPGDANEAVGCVHLLGKAWRNHPEAVAWLKELALK